MTIGELLRDYRVGKGKKQKEFVGNVISPSYYSKIEKNKHQISATDLIELLRYNNISTTDFFSNLDQDDKAYNQQIRNISNLMLEAYYQVDRDKMINLKSMVQNSNLSKKDQEEQILMIDGFLELLNGNHRVSDSKEIRNNLKKKIFDIPNLNSTKLMLYCNSMRFYSLSDNKLISKNIVHQFRDSKDVEIQKRILAIIINLLVFSVENNDYDGLDFFIDSANKIPANPELFFYKNVLFFYKSYSI